MIYYDKQLALVTADADLWQENMLRILKLFYTKHVYFQSNAK